MRAVRSRPSCRDCGVPEKTVLTYFPTKKVADPGPPSYFVAVGSPGLVTVTVFPPPPLLTMAWLASYVPLPSLAQIVCMAKVPVEVVRSKEPPLVPRGDPGALAAGL